MYLPPQFDAKEAKHAVDLMREHPFASLISTDDSGTPFVTHLPLHLQQEDPSDCGPTLPILLGHCAKANRHWQYLAARPQALVTFLGPHAYLSPSVYPDLARVPTWNYLAVHCVVQARLIEDANEKDRLLKHIIADHEPAYAAQWQALDQEFARKMLGAIVGFELRVTDLQCKLKLNQHRPESHLAMKAMYAQGDDSERALAHWMQRLGIDGATQEQGVRK